MTYRLQCTLTNESSRTLTLVELKLQQGRLISAPAQQTLAPKETVEWVVEADGDLSGWALYKVDAGGDWSMFECGFRRPLGEPLKGWTVHRLPQARTKSPCLRALRDSEEDTQLKFRFVMPSEGPTQPSFQAYDVRNVNAPDGKTTHVSLPGGPRAAMICPEGKYDKLCAELRKMVNEPGEEHLPDHMQNRVFAEQWLRADEANRSLYFLSPSNDFAAFCSKVKEAAEWVGGGEIILFIGHGGAAGANRQQTGFDTIPETGPMSSHRHMITEVLVCDFPEACEKKDGKWQYKPRADNTKIIDERLSNESVATLGTKWDALGELGQTLEKTRLKLFTVLSCHVGSDKKRFVGKLAQRLRTSVRAYTRFVLLGDTVRTDNVPAEQLWLGVTRTDETLRPKHPSPADPSFHAVPTTNAKIGNRAGQEFE